MLDSAYLAHVVNTPSRQLDQTVPLSMDSNRDLTHAMLITWLMHERMRRSFDPATRKGSRRIAKWCRRAVNRNRSLLGRVGAAFSKKLRPAREPSPGASLVGYARGVLGMGEHVRMSARAMKAVSVPIAVVDFAPGLDGRLMDTPPGLPMRRDNLRRCNILHMNADQMPTAYWHLGPDFFANRYNIGYWAWELPLCPAPWRPAIGFVDEIWVPSRFVRDAYVPFTSKPVILMPLCVELPAFVSQSRESYGISDDEFAFCFTMDCRSHLPRKNPAATIRSFRLAFPGAERVSLTIKTMNADPVSPAWRALQAEAQGDPRVRIIDATWPAERVLGLIDNCDCYISLHRSEGFGRGPAEAMLLGKPVIVSDFSGTQDYCRQDNSLLVDCRMVDVQKDDYVLGEGQQWADPDTDHAATHMRRLFEDRELGIRIGAAGRTTIETEFSAERIGRRYQARLAELGMLD